MRVRIDEETNYQRGPATGGPTAGRRRVDVPRARAGADRGSALVIALLVVVIMTLLGLSFMLGGETESRIARNQRDAAQAGFVAEGGVRMVKKWFDAPAGPNAHLVPTVAQMDRTLRHVDPANNGTYVLWSSAPSPFNVMYRGAAAGIGHDDPFAKPYRGKPEWALLGTEANPDIRISDSALPVRATAGAEQTFLATVNNSLYPAFPATNQRTRIRQIDVYSPPILDVGGQRERFGIATIKVTADVYQYAGTTNETRIATRIVKAVLNETPFTQGIGGPLQSCVDIRANGNLETHWGATTAFRVLDLPNNLDQGAASSVPFPVLNNMHYILLPDANGDGTAQASGASSTPDDQNHNNTLDYDDWRSGVGVDDPWATFLSEGTVQSGGSESTVGWNYTCTSFPCQPSPYYDPSSNSLGTGARDHSNIFKNVPRSLCPQFDYALWKGVALGGGDHVYYYQSDGTGTGHYLLFGAGAPVDFVTAVNDKNGLFFFDTRTNTAPEDTNNDGTYDNLEAQIQISGQGLTMAGFIYLNADFRTTGSGSVSHQSKLIAPAEPYLDANFNGRYDDGEWFIDLDYPTNVGNAYGKNAPQNSAALRQDPAVSAAGGSCVASQGCWMADINMYGVFYTNGVFDVNGNWTFFGDTISKEGLTNSSGSPLFYFDERLTKDGWPPFDLNLPRTIITAWETDL